MSDAEPLTEQVNIRLTKRDHDVLRALIFLDDDKGSATDVLRAIVQQYLGAQANDEEVAGALEMLARRRAKKDGKVASLREKARKPQAGA
jgi:hypothetical protein